MTGSEPRDPALNLFATLFADLTNGRRSQRIAPRRFSRFLQNHLPVG
jgi:hypothetical protein